MNNGFQGVDPGIGPWAAVGAAAVSQDSATPLTGAIASTLRIQASQSATGAIGASNAGYGGLRGVASSLNGEV